MVRTEESWTHNREYVGLYPNIYWMDVCVARNDIKRKTIKVAKWGTPKKEIIKVLFFT